MTDTELTLQALQNAGNAGVHSFDLNRLVGTIRAAARVNDLKNLGYQITARPETLGNARGVRYFLVSSPKATLFFDAIRQVQVYVEVKEAITQPMTQPVQEALL